MLAADESPKKGESPQWRYFKNVSVEIGHCKLCNVDVQRCKGTTNLKKHLSAKHKKEFAELYPDSDPKTQKITSFMGLAS